MPSKRTVLYVPFAEGIFGRIKSTMMTSMLELRTTGDIRSVSFRSARSSSPISITGQLSSTLRIACVAPRVIAQLVCEPHALRGGVVEVCCAVAIFAPHEAEYEAMGIQVLDGPWLDVVELDELEAFDPEPASERCEYTWICEQSVYRMCTYVQKDSPGSDSITEKGPPTRSIEASMSG